jgi:hypothetical protein
MLAQQLGDFVHIYDKVKILGVFSSDVPTTPTG